MQPKTSLGKDPERHLLDVTVGYRTLTLRFPVMTVSGKSVFQLRTPLDLHDLLRVARGRHHDDRDTPAESQITLAKARLNAWSSCESRRIETQMGFCIAKKKGGTVFSPTRGASAARFRPLNKPVWSLSDAVYSPVVHQIRRII